MSSRDQLTPPFQSPYQQVSKSSSMLQTPAYPSPARSDSEPVKYAPDGLGLYNYPPHFAISGPSSSSVLFPPSPHPTEAWSHLPGGPSPLISEPIVDPWASGAYDHPVSRSPLPWSHYQASHRSSLSSPRAMSVFSGDGSEHGFAHVKLEGGSDWTTDEESSPPGTVAPGRLTNTGMFSYDNTYDSPSIPRLEATPESSYDYRHSEHMSQQEFAEGSQTEGHASATPRVRRRRGKTAPEDAKFSCEICGRGFIRSYNKKSHMERHNPNRQKNNKCQVKDCQMRFERKTDLDRHYTSVHEKSRRYKCSKCDNGFARKDTLRRHEEDGCNKRNQLSPSSLLSRSHSLRSASVAESPYYHSARPDMYAAPMGYQPASMFDAKPQHHEHHATFDPRSPHLFRDHTFGGSAHGY